MLKVGLTGGVGSGKSTVTTCFQALGVPVIDADDIARALVKPGLPAYEKIIECFGAGILNEQQALDRAKLRELIFSDNEAKVTLEALLHPLVYQTIKQQVSQLNAVYCIISIPLLIETGGLSQVDRVLVVDVAPELQITRILRRDGGGRAQAEAMIKSQIDRQTRLSYADEVLDNSADIEALKSAVDKLHADYCR